MTAIQYNPRGPKEAFARLALAATAVFALMGAIRAHGEDIHAYRRTLSPRIIESTYPVEQPPRSDAASRSSTVVIGGCSGVCVSPEGHILTAGHCRHGETEQVIWPDGRKIAAHKVYDDGKAEGCVVFDCDGDGFPCVSVSDECPQKGERVYSLGYPVRGDRRHMEYGEGRMLGGDVREDSGDEFYCNFLTDIGSAPGWSGGPLFNAHSEVIGVCRGAEWEESPLTGRKSDVRSVFVSWGACFAAYNQAVRQDAELLAYVSEGCHYCHQFLSDSEEYNDKTRRGKFNGIPFKAIYVTDQEVPHFTFRGQKTVGYHNREQLAGWLDEQMPRLPATQRPLNPAVCTDGVCRPGVEQRLFPRLFPRANPSPVDGDALQPTDLENIRVVVCLNSGLSLGSWVGSGVALSEDAIQKLAAEHDISVIPYILSYSANPDGYDKFASAAGVTGKVTIVALIPERESMSGIVRSQIVSAIERVIKRKLDNLPLKVHFQRTDAESYTAAMDALLAYSPADDAPVNPNQPATGQDVVNAGVGVGSAYVTANSGIGSWVLRLWLWLKAWLLARIKREDE